MTDALIAPQRIEFIIPGTPQQQGSKTRMPNGFMVESNKKLGSWRRDAIAAAQAAYQGPKIMGPVFVTARFYFGRPKGHFGSGRNAGRLKLTAPTYYASAPDLDKLQRALGDVLTQAGLILDDRLIVKWIEPVKLWTLRAPRTEVAIFTADTL